MERVFGLAAIIMIIAGTVLGVQHLVGIDSASGHSSQSQGRAWVAGSRCISPSHIANKHGGSVAGTDHQDFATSAYTVGRGNGTGAVNNVEASVEYVNQWEATVSWKAPGYNNGTWACQPYAYVMQRKIGSGGWEHWQSERRYPATVESDKRVGIWGGQAAYSKDTTSDLSDLSSLTTVYYRVCGVSSSAYNTYMDSGQTASDLATFSSALQACVNSNAIELGGSTWDPRFSRTNTDTFSEGGGSISIALESTPAPPERRTKAVSWAVNAVEGACNVSTGDSGTADISFSTAGIGTLSLPNPNPFESAFIDDCRVNYSLEQLSATNNWSFAGSITVYVKDNSAFSIQYTTDNTDPRTLSEDGPDSGLPTTADNGATIWPNQMRVNTLINGATIADNRLNCPSLARFEQEITITPFGGASSDDYSITPATAILGDYPFYCADELVIEALEDNLVESGEGIRVSFGGLTRFEDGSAVSTSLVSGSWGSSRTFSLSFIDENDNGKVGVGLASSAYTVNAGDPLTVRVYGYDHAGRRGSSQCDTNSSGTLVDFQVGLHDLSSRLASVNAQVRHSCYTDVTLQIPNDADPALEIRLESIGSQGEAHGNSTADVTVFSDDTNLIISPTLTVDEGSSRSISLLLESRPTSDVTISVTGSLRGDMSMSPDLFDSSVVLTFTPSNWSPKLLTFTAAQDRNTSDSHSHLSFRAISTDTRYDGETADLTVTADDDDYVPLEFTSFSHPVLHRDDKVVVTATFPHYQPDSTDACRVDYVRLYSERTNLTMEDGGHPATDVFWTYVRVPYDPDLTYWTVTENRDSSNNLLWREYTQGPYVFRHYENGQDSVFTWNDDTPDYAEGGTIKFYSIGSRTWCHDNNQRWVSAPVPSGANDTERRASCQADADCRWVNYTVD